MVAIRRLALLAATALVPFCAANLRPSPALAEFIVTVVQDGSNVVLTGNGTIDTADLTPLAVVSAASGMIPRSKFIIVGPPAYASLQEYFTSGHLAPFGSGGSAGPGSSGSGDTVGFQVSELYVPHGYASGASLSDTSTYDNATFASLGLTVGTYTASWGSGADADSFVLEIGVNPVPEPSGAAVLLLPLAALRFLSAARIRRDSKQPGTAARPP